MRCLECSDVFFFFAGVRRGGEGGKGITRYRRCGFEVNFCSMGLRVHGV